MLHRCIEGERVGDDGGEVVGVDRRHNGCPGGVPAPPGETGREPPSFFFFLGHPLDGRRVPPLVHGHHGSRRGGAPPRLDLSLSVLFYFAFLFSGRKPFLKFPEIRNSDWAEILRGFLSRYYLCCGERRVPTALRGSNKPAGRAQGRGHAPRACGPLGHRLTLILFPKNYIYFKINLCKFLSYLDFV